MKKKLLTLVLLVVLVMSVTVIAACSPRVTVTFYDGTTVLKTVKVAEGKTIDSYIPSKDGGYEFVNWFSTPSLTHKYDFKKAITEDISVFAGFTLYSEDTREFYIVGAGTSNLMFLSNWGNGENAFDEDHKMAKTASKNEYTITVDLMADDEFQFALNKQWHNKRGYGYLNTTTLEDGTEAFSGSGGGLGEVTAKGKNTKVVLSGNYTFTLKTYPNEDAYNTTDPTYTDATKEVYNYGTFDTVEWVRNGDVVEKPVVETNYYIKGSGISGWQNAITPAHKFTNNEGVYTLSVYLKQGEEFLFISTNTQLGSTTDGTKFIRANALDTASAALFTTTASANIITKATGTYTFTYDSAADKLSATLDEAAKPALRDYYLDGTFAGAWGDTMYGVADKRVVGSQGGSSYKFISDYKLKETAANSGIFEILDVELPAGTQLIIQSYKKGSTEPGVWNTPGYNMLGTFNYNYLVPKNAAFEPVSSSNLNIQVKTAGVYNIQYNSYSNTINITDGYDVYIKGDMNSWTHGYSKDWKLVQSATDKNLYELTLAFAVNAQAGLAKYNKGANDPTNNGTWVGRADLGTAGDANSIFNPGSGGNLKCSEAGTYKLVYNVSSGKIDIYKVAG